MLLLLLLLIQIKTSNLVDAKEDVRSSEKETKTSEKDKDEEEGAKTSEKEEKDKDEEEEDTCLSSPCGSHARCKNVQVCLGVHMWGKNVIVCGSRTRCKNV